jgi:hypothetical protein
MKNKSGIPAYDDGLFFILRGNDGKHWPPRSVQAVRNWRMTKMLAYQFKKPVSVVARDVMDLAQILEEGEHGKRQRDQSSEGHPGDRAAAGRR